MEEFTYRELQAIFKKWWIDGIGAPLIDRRSSKYTLYNILKTSGVLPNKTLYKLPLPLELVDHIILLGGDDLYSLFSFTAWYWYNRIQSTYEKRYIRLGRYISPTNRFSYKSLYNRDRLIYGDKLVKIRLSTNEQTALVVPLSSNIESYGGLPLLKLADGTYDECGLNSIYKRRDDTHRFLYVNNTGELWMLSYWHRRTRVMMDSAISKILNILPGVLDIILTIKGKVYSYGSKDDNITSISSPPLICNIITNADKVYGLGYNNVVYQLCDLFQDTVYWNIICASGPFNIIQNICCSGDRIYYIVIDNEISTVYYKYVYDEYNKNIHILKTPMNIKYTTSVRNKQTGNQTRIYASHNRIFKHEYGEDVHEYLLDITRISSVYVSGDILYILGK